MPTAATSVVLVHGAFADGSAWARVIPLLHAQGLEAVAVQNPLTSLEEDMAHVQRAIDRVKGPVLLVGHSWGGAVITQIGGQEKVTGLVYVAAFAPDAGQSPNDTLKPFPPSPGLAAVSVDKAGYLFLSPAALAATYAQDLPEEETALLAAIQGPCRAACFATRVTEAAWRTKPSRYVVAAQDRMLPPAFQRATAARIGARTVEVDASHVPYASRPQAVAAVIIEAARG
ncbi:alpha/beta fold hydrolase [Azospirillum halopraeferens]|uniref:alpha/beta fold hydrolase n=1 Tax=Azospirillum halopraeferens TaxID=34010 RepID=UPI000412C609|nr:alpha/beta hydrolase [Azospirillum halopraeferens]